MRSTRRAIMFKTLACVALVSLLHTRHAEPAYAEPASDAAALPAEVLVILASDEGKVDPSLKDIEALRKPPFNGFKAMKVLSRRTLKLSGNAPETADLPNGRRMQIERLETQPDGRLKVRVSINKPKTKDYLPGMVVVASPGEPFFVAGQKHEGGTLIIGIRVGVKAAKAD